MYVRTSITKMRPEQLDEALRQFREKTMPELHRIQGFEGVNVLQNRDTGEMRVMTYYGSEQDLKATLDQAVDVRRRAMQGVGVESEPTPFEHYEVVLTEGRVPMAKAA